MYICKLDKLILTLREAGDEKSTTKVPLLIKLLNYKPIDSACVNNEISRLVKVLLKCVFLL